MGTRDHEQRHEGQVVHLAAAMAHEAEEAFSRADEEGDEPEDVELPVDDLEAFFAAVEQVWAVRLVVIAEDLSAVIYGRQTIADLGRSVAAP